MRIFYGAASILSEVMRNIFERVVLLSFIVVAIFISGCLEKSDKITGYIEGRFVYASSVRSGNLKQLLVRRGDKVKPGQLLFVLDEEPETSSLNRSLAELNTLRVEQQYAEKNLDFTDKVLERRTKLAQVRSIDPESVDSANIKHQEAVQNFGSVNSRLLATQADIRRLQWAKEQKSVYAGVYGKVFDTFFLPSEFVPGGKPVLSILPTNEIYVVFFVSELQLSQTHSGQSIELTCDGSNIPISAKINFVSPQAEFTPPVLYEVKRRGDLEYRVEAKPNSIDHYTYPCLHPGQPVTINLLK